MKTFSLLVTLNHSRIEETTPLEITAMALSLIPKSRGSVTRAPISLLFLTPFWRQRLENGSGEREEEGEESNEAIYATFSLSLPSVRPSVRII